MLRPYERATTDDKQSDKAWSSNLLLRSRGRPSRTGFGLATGQPTDCRFELSRRFPTEQAALKSVSGHPIPGPTGKGRARWSMRWNPPSTRSPSPQKAASPRARPTHAQAGSTVEQTLPLEYQLRCMRASGLL